MIGAPHCRNVASRSSFVAPLGAFATLLTRETASMEEELSHSVMIRSWSAMPACLRISRSYASPDIDAEVTSSQASLGRAFLRHRGALLRHHSSCWTGTGGRLGRLRLFDAQRDDIGHRIP